MEYSRRPTKSIPKENQLKILNKIYQTYLVSTTLWKPSAVKMAQFALILTKWMTLAKGRHDQLCYVCVATLAPNLVHDSWVSPLSHILFMCPITLYVVLMVGNASLYFLLGWAQGCRLQVRNILLVMVPWASYQISKIAGCTCAGNAANVFPAIDLKKETAS